MINYKKDLSSIIDNFISSKDSNKSLDYFKYNKLNPIITLTEASMYEEQENKKDSEDNPTKDDNQDNSRKESNKKSMVESNIKVFGGDILKEIYYKLNKENGSSSKLKSVDAIFKFLNNKIYLIEFKSGSLKENKQEHVADIYKKAYDTLLLFLEMKIIKELSESIQNIIYILVYDHSKYVNNNNSSKHKLRTSMKNKLQNYKEHLGIRNDYILQISLFQGNVFKDAYGVDVEDFKSEILPELEAEK